MSDAERLEIAELTRSATASDTDDASQAIWIAEQLLERARQLQTPQERRQQAELDRMIGQPIDKATLVEMTDQAFRTLTPARVADQLTHILDLQGVPRFFSPLERTMLRGFQSFGEYLPGVAVPLVKDKMRRETANVILPAEQDMLAEHLRQRQQQGLRMNVNFLGEALLGEDDAQSRLEKYLTALRTPEIECISVKITTIYSQVSALAREHTVRVVADRMELLYRAAAREVFRHSDGRESSKFVYLDMEEYRDLHLTAEILCRALSREGMDQVRAGIALQAYVPDSYDVLLRLIDFAQQRVARGGRPLTIRLVKGANMEMERVDASLGGWAAAPYANKRDTDANYKRMLREMLDEKNAAAIRVGVASHNLFDISLAMLWAARNQQLDRIQFEMLEGMANHQRRALFEASQSMLLYAPACRREEFLHAIGYLVRRLDENTGPENFLRHAFRLEVGTPTWDELANDFRLSLNHMNSVSSQPRRTQNRSLPPEQPAPAPSWSEFDGEADTDWALPIHSEWAADIIAQWRDRCDANATEVPLFVAGQETPAAGRERRASRDPSRPEVTVCRYTEASDEDIDRALACASDDPTQWRQTPREHRHRLLRAAAQRMRERRADLIGVAIAEGGKTIAEADPEVSEAIDFAEFYPLTVDALANRPAIESQPRGVVLVVSPWNFPLAIPCGGVAAALAAGNTVILKPASDTVLAAHMICHCFWEAGVPREALQLLPCAGSRGGSKLVNDPRVSTVILTGGTATARRMLEDRPGLHLIAETGGKNATIVTALSDRDLAIKNVLHSAFGHSGQKCSATSLLLLEDEVYEDPAFRETLADAVRSLPVGSAWDLTSRVGPLIRPPSGELARGLKELEPGESWLVMPERVSDNPHLYRPGVKWNVRPGGFTHRTELFGPVLGVMRYRRLEDAIGIVNATGYGLTSGLESLDDREQQIWQESIRAGNLYTNRPTTGAIVLRQPFGGVGSSAYGPGVKAGGPNYVLPLMHLRDRAEHDATATSIHADLPPTLQPLDTLAAEWESDGTVAASDLKPIQTMLTSLAEAARDEFSREHDSVQLIGQDNLRRYRPIRQLRIRLSQTDLPRDVVVAVSAALAVGTAVTLSHDSWVEPTENTTKLLRIVTDLADTLPGKVEVIEESTSDLATAIRSGDVDRLRCLEPQPPQNAIAAACCEAFISTIEEPVVLDGYIEGLRYLSEQSWSFSYHRYGNLGRRGVAPHDVVN
ncbi:MAG: proline dehydrogenase [Blastopirellula sp.]|nr:proline dehydrogenase [Blastopirellula sp.]